MPTLSYVVIRVDAARHALCPLTVLLPAQVRGFSVGCFAHVAGMAALTAAGETAAAEWAAVAFFLMGTYRCLLLQVPWFNETLQSACLAEDDTT